MKTDSRKQKIGRKQRIIIAISAVILAIIALTAGIIAILPGKNDTEESYTVSAFNTINGKFTDIKITDEESAIEAVRDAAKILGLENAAEELTAKRTDTVGDLTYYRISQNYNGLPVYGCSFVVVADENGEALCLTGNAEDIDNNISLTPTATQEQINAAIRAEFEGNEDIVISEVSDDMLVIYNLDDVEDAVLAYEICITTNGYNYRVITSAIDGTIISTSPLTFFNILNKAMDTDKGIKIFNALNTYYYDYIYKAGQQVEQPVASKEDKKAFDLFYCISKTYDFFDEVIGIKGYNGKGGGVYLFYDAVFKDDLGIMYGNNACSLGEHTLEDNQNITILVFGNECDIDIDTVAHEYMHSVEQSMKGLTYSGESGAIMEGYSDIFGELVEDWSDNNNLDNSCNWFTENGDIFNDRNMASPKSSLNPRVYHGTFWKDSEDLKDDHGGIHTNSTVISHIAYNMTQSTQYTALSNSDIAKLWYQTLFVLPTDCCFEELRIYMELTAQKIGLSKEKQQQVSLAFDMANIIVEDKKVSEDFNIIISGIDNTDYYKNCKVSISGILKTGFQDRTITRNITLTGEKTEVHLDKGEYTINVYNKNTGELLFTRDIEVNKKYDDEYVIFFIENMDEQTEETTSISETTVTPDTTSTPETEEIADIAFSVTHSYNGVTTDILTSGSIKMFNGSATQTWTVTSNCEWSISTSSTSGNWFSIDKLSGSKGTTQNKITIPNYTLTQNNGVVIFNVNDKKYKVRIYQEADSIGATVTNVIYPLKDVEVNISNPNYSAKTYTDENGRFGIAVPDGWYTVTLTKEGFAPKELSVYCGSGEVADMGIISLDLETAAVPTFTVTGRIVKFDGKTPHIGANVRIYNDSFEITATVDDNGFFSAEVPNGDYSFAVSAPESFGSKFMITSDWGTICHVTDNGVDLGTFSISTLLRGMVTEGTPDSDNYGKPLEDVKIMILDSNGQNVTGVLISSVGYDNSGLKTNYFLTFNSPGTYDLIFTKDGYQDFTIEDYLVDNNSMRIPDVSLVKIGSVIPTETTEHTHEYATTENAATCTAEGKIVSSCSCGDVKTEVLPMIEHNFVGNVCSMCGININNLPLLGSGTVDDPYQVRSAKHLDMVRNDLKAHYIQMNDIDLSEFDNFLPIGKGNSQRKLNPSVAEQLNYNAAWFEGTYDGNGYKITGLKIYQTELDCVGLFSGASENSNLINITIENASVIADKLDFDYESFYKKYGTIYNVCAGILVGDSSGKIKNCNVSGKLTVINATVICAGGIIGQGGDISFCDSNVEIYVEANKNYYKNRIYYDAIHCGGIAGYAGKVYNCRNYGNIIGNSNSNVYIGGISGSNGVIQNCINYGNVTGMNNFDEKTSFVELNVGGIVGYDNGRYTGNCINFGNINTECVTDGARRITVRIGGIVGKSGSFGNGKIENCINGNKEINCIFIEKTDEDGETIKYEKFIYAHRIVGALGGYNTDKQINNYSIAETLVCGEIPTDLCTLNGFNGENISQAELELKLAEITAYIENNK